MKASIIIGTYNHKEYTIQAIEACLAQDFKGEYEIIIVDDGSTDGSIEAIKEYAAKYPKKIKYAVMDRNDGVDIMLMRTSHVREKGLAMSSGEYLLLLDGDDLITPNKLSLQIDFLEKNPKLVACFTDFYMFWDNGYKIYYRCSASNIDRSFYWGNGSYMHSSCFVFRRSVMDNFVHSFVVDNPATFSILKTGKVAHIPGITFMYRQREKSVIHSFDETEKRVREILVFQALMSAGGYRCATISRYGSGFRKLFQQRNEMNEDRYCKYINYTQNMTNNKNKYLLYIKDYDTLGMIRRISFRVIMLQTIAYKSIYYIRRKFYKMTHGKDLICVSND